MNPNVQAQLRTSLQNLSNVYQVGVSTQAEFILGESLTAITEDPHKSWPTHVRNQPEPFSDDMIKALPAALAKIANDSGLSQITSFDLLHSMTRLVELLCPFTKPPTP